MLDEVVVLVCTVLTMTHTMARSLFDKNIIL